MTMVEIIEFTTFVLVVFTAWMLCTQTVAVYRLFGGRFLDLGPFVWGNSSMNWIWWYRDWETDRKSTRLNSSHSAKSRMPSSA